MQGCSSGVKYQNYPTLQDLTFEKGAHFALGTYDTVYTDDGNFFLENVILMYSKGSSLRESIEYAQSQFVSYRTEQGEIIVTDVYLPTYGIIQNYYPIIYTGDIYQKNLFGGARNENS